AHIHSDRTCPVCIAMHGTFHTLDETMDSHPACRCAMIPWTRSWEELGFPGIPDRRTRVEPGVEWFARQDAATQRRILGPAKYAAYQAGDLELMDLVGVKTHPRWGRTRFERSLRSILGERQATAYIREAMAADQDHPAECDRSKPSSIGYDGGERRLSTRERGSPWNRRAHHHRRRGRAGDGIAGSGCCLPCSRSWASRGCRGNGMRRLPERSAPPRRHGRGTRSSGWRRRRGRPLPRFRSSSVARRLARTSRTPMVAAAFTRRARRSRG